MFAVPYDAVNANQSNFHMKTLKPDLRFVFNMQAQPWGGSASSPQFIDTYDKDDGRLGDTWMMGPQRDAQGRAGSTKRTQPQDTKNTERRSYFIARAGRAGPG